MNPSETLLVRRMSGRPGRVELFSYLNIDARPIINNIYCTFPTLSFLSRVTWCACATVFCEASFDAPTPLIMTYTGQYICGIHICKDEKIFLISRIFQTNQASNILHNLRWHPFTKTLYSGDFRKNNSFFPIPSTF